MLVNEAIVLFDNFSLILALSLEFILIYQSLQLSQLIFKSLIIERCSLLANTLVKR